MLTALPNTEKRLEYARCTAIYLTNCVQTLSPVFDLSFLWKLKLRRKQKSDCENLSQLGSDIQPGGNHDFLCSNC